MFKEFKKLLISKKIICYEINCLLYILALMTILKPIIVANIDDPPYDIIGRGEPTIGTKPKTMLIFTDM